MIKSLVPPVLRSLFSCVVFAVSSLVCAAPALCATSIHPGDKLQITVFNHDNLSTQAVVSSNGNVALPLVGDVSLDGLTQQQAAQHIQSALSRYLRFPAVQVDVLQQSQTIFFTGLVSGIQPYQPGET